MIRRTRCRSATRFSVAVLFLAASLGAHWVARGDAPAPAATPAVLKLPDEAEKKLKKAVGVVTAAVRKQFDKQVKEDTDELAKVAGVTPEQMASLRPAAAAAEEKSVGEFGVRIDQTWRDYYHSSPEEFDSTMDTLTDETFQISESMSWGYESTRPFEQALWKTALDRTLTEEQKAAWKKALTDRAPAFDAETVKFLAAQEDRLREQAKTMIASAVGGITQNLTLSPERVTALDILAADAAQRSAHAQREQIAGQFSHMDAKAREAMVKQRNAYYTIQDKDAPVQQSVWTEGVAKLLTDDERAILKKAAEEHRKQRLGAYAQIFVTVLDEKVAFTAAQRERLLPLAEKAVAKSPALSAEHSRQTYYSTSLKTFYQAAGDVPEEEVKTILDPLQWEHWHALQEKALHPSADGGDDEDRQIIVNRPKPRAAATPSPTPLLEPDEVECAVSDFMADKTARQRQSSLARLSLEAEDFARVAALPPATLGTLRLAALGASEEEMNTYKLTTENMIRGQINDARPENIRQKLAGIQSYYFTSRRSSTPLNKLPFWTQTVARQTTEEQRAAWEKEKGLRADARYDAIAAIITAQFDREVTVSPAQWKTVQEKISAIIKEYKTDFDNYFSSSNGTPWYLQTYSMFIPLAGIPEAEMKTLLDKGQMDRWTGSNGFSNAESYWDNIKTNHERVKKAATK